MGLPDQVRSACTEVPMFRRVWKVGGVALLSSPDPKFETAYPGFRVSWSRRYSVPIVSDHRAPGASVIRPSSIRRSTIASSREA